MIDRAAMQFKDRLTNDELDEIAFQLPTPEQIDNWLLKNKSKLLIAFEELVLLRDMRPEKCRPWLSGSGGHKVFCICNSWATWSDAQNTDMSFAEYYCDEHKPAHELDLKEVPWVILARELNFLEVEP